MSFQWAHPWALLLVIPVLAYLGWVLRGGRRGLSLPRTGSMLAAGAATALWKGSLPQILRATALTLLVLVLARPRGAEAVIEESIEGVPIVIAFDISSSMLAEDFAPRNRLEVARRTTAEFVRSRRADPIGLVAFAGEAITQVPLTTDHRVIHAALEALRIGLLEDGTAIGMGLATAATRLAPATGESRVIILLSDGENNRGAIQPLDAAAAAAVQGIRVFTIGVGTDGAAPVPVFRAPDGTVQYAELSAGLDEVVLQRIAEITGGEYFRADSPEALSTIYQHLDQLVPARVDTRRYVVHSEWYFPLMLLATVSLLCEWFLRGSRWGRIP